MAHDQVAALARTYRAAMKAAAPPPTADPTVTPVRGADQVPGAYPVATSVPNPSPELTQAGWPGAGPAQRLGDGVGLTGLDVGGYPVPGHSDRLQPANDRVVGSMAMDPNAQEITGGAHARGTDFNSNPVSPLQRGMRIDLRDIGRR